MAKFSPSLPITLAGLGLLTFAVLTLIGKMGMGDFMPLVETQVRPVDMPMAINGGTSAGIAVGGGESDAMYREKMMAPDMGYYPQYQYDQALEIENRLYEKSSYHSVVVSDVAEYTRSLREYFLSIDGRIINTQSGIEGKYHTANLTVKVPVQKFDEAASRVTENVKKVMNENINANDVTGQVVSIDKQLASLESQQLENQLQLEAAKTDADKRRIQLKIDQLNKQIEQVKANQKATGEQVTYATVSVSVANNERYFTGNYYPGNGIDSDFYSAWESLKIILRKLLSVGIWALVYGVLWLPIVLIVRWFKRPKSVQPAE